LAIYNYWKLLARKSVLNDDRIKGHEVDYARVNAKVTALPRVGLNPYALGMRLFQHIENSANKGKFSYEFQRIENAQKRKAYDAQTAAGPDYVFKVRENYTDLMFINTFVDQDFVDLYRLFVTGKRINSQKGVWEYYVKSRALADYKQMLMDSLYHPPFIEIDETKMANGYLYLNHHFEGKPLVKDFIHNTMLGIEYLWGGPVKLETTERVPEARKSVPAPFFALPIGAGGESAPKKKPRYQRVVYTMEKRELKTKPLFN